MEDSDTWNNEGDLGQRQAFSTHNRPYGGNQPIGVTAVEAWIDRARAAGLVSILFLLDDTQLRLYTDCSGGLLQRYRHARFGVGELRLGGGGVTRSYEDTRDGNGHHSCPCS